MKQECYHIHIQDSEMSTKGTFHHLKKNTHEREVENMRIVKNREIVKTEYDIFTSACKY